MPHAELLQPRRLNLGGKVYHKGQLVPVDFQTAFELNANPRFKVSGLDTREAVEFKENQLRPRGKDLYDAINAAASELDIDDEQNFDGGGKPSVAALSKALGYEITKDERDSALNAVDRAPQSDGVTTADEVRTAAAGRIVVHAKKKAAEPAALVEQGVKV